jgi:hypothetical protein
LGCKSNGFSSLTNPDIIGELLHGLGLACGHRPSLDSVLVRGMAEGEGKEASDDL